MYNLVLLVLISVVAFQTQATPIPHYCSLMKFEIDPCMDPKHPCCDPMDPYWWTTTTSKPDDLCGDMIDPCYNPRHPCCCYPNKFPKDPCMISTKHPCCVPKTTTTPKPDPCKDMIDPCFIPWSECCVGLGPVSCTEKRGEKCEPEAWPHGAVYLPKPNPKECGTNGMCFPYLRNDSEVFHGKCYCNPVGRPRNVVTKV